MKKTLILLAHPHMEQSRLNKTLLEAIKNESDITVHDLYEHYDSNQDIDVAKEQELLLTHDRIIFNFHFIGSVHLAF